MKRFWNDVAIIRANGGSGLTLDGKPVRTPGRAPLTIPTVSLAEAIADEWRAVADDIDPRTMPLTGLANAAIDRIAPDPTTFAAELARYGETDLLCYRAESPDELIARQVALWEPYLDWARERYDVHFERVAGVMHRPQPTATIARLGEATAARDPFALAGLSPVVTITGSLVLALALAEGATDGDTAWTAARCDDAWQAEQWGEDSFAAKQAMHHRAEFDAAVSFLSLLKP